MTSPAGAAALLLAGLCVLPAALASCDLPRDPEGTLLRVRDGTLRAGYVENAPWVAGDGEPRGVEAELVREFARELNARVEWTRGSHAQLIEALERFEIDLVVGGLTRSAPGVAWVAATRPYHTSRVVVGAPPDLPPIREVEELRVAVEEDDLVTRGHLRSRGAVPVVVPDLSRVRGPVAGPDWKLDALGFRETGIVLYREHHVMAMPPGENGFLVRLEGFLRPRRSAVEGLLVRSAR